MRTLLLSSVLCALLARAGWSDEPTRPVEMTLRPRAVESPVMKYRLLPAEAEIKAGNAVPILLRLPWEQNQWMSKVFPTLHEWEARPLTAPDWRTSDGVLPLSFYRELKRAAYRRDADWEYPIGEQSGYSILLPDVQGLRGFLVSGLSARIRYHLSRGELEPAREGILVGLANGRHLAQTPFFVNQLVAATIQRAMLERTAELIVQPNCPNMYWALSTLPESLIELDRAADFEGTLFAQTFPVAEDLDRPRDAKEWRKMGDQLVKLLEELQEIPPAPAKPAAEGPIDDILIQLLQRLGVGETGRMAFAKAAREELAELTGLPADKVAAMSDDEVGIRWYVRRRLSRDQKAAAVMRLQPREAWPRLAELQAESDALKAKMGGKGIEFLNPVGIYVSAWSLRRQVDSLRIVEAVRDHLARKGNLPKMLGEIEGLSIPSDALTGEPFGWSVEGKTAVLKMPALPESLSASAKSRAGAMEYRIRVE
jgi:hypothetical protein